MQMKVKSQRETFYEQVIDVLKHEWAHVHIMRRGMYGRILASMGAWVYSTAGDNVLGRDVVNFFFEIRSRQFKLYLNLVFYYIFL